MRWGCGQGQGTPGLQQSVPKWAVGLLGPAPRCLPIYPAAGRGQKYIHTGSVRTDAAPVKSAFWRRRRFRGPCVVPMGLKDHFQCHHFQQSPNALSPGLLIPVSNAVDMAWS